MALSSRKSSQKRSQRVRTRLRKVANGRPRLSVFRSSKNIYAQVIDDERGVTLAAASSLEGGDKKAKAKGSDKEEVYYFDTDSSKKNHKAICTEAKKGTVTGTISEKDGKMIVTVKDVKFD